MLIFVYGASVINCYSGERSSGATGPLVGLVTPTEDNPQGLQRLAADPVFRNWPAVGVQVGESFKLRRVAIDDALGCRLALCPTLKHTSPPLFTSRGL